MEALRRSFGGRGEEHGEVLTTPGDTSRRIGAPGRPSELSQVKGKTVPAKKIPYWLWVLIAKSLGIKLHDRDKPIVSAILHIFTFGSAVGLFVTNAWFSGYNILSVHTKNDVLDGTVSIMVMSFFCGLGVYSHRLAYRLFVHPKFLDMLRLHSKTVFKINSALVIFVVLLSFVVALNISTSNYTYPYNYNGTGASYSEMVNLSWVNPCQLVDVTVQVCQVYWVCQMVFSVFFLLWNLLVAVVLVSVARTQTISIRRFLKELEFDAQLLDRQIGSSYRQEAPAVNHYMWTDDDSIADYFTDRSQDGSNVQTMRESVASGGRRESASSFKDLQLRIGPGPTTPDADRPSRAGSLVDSTPGGPVLDRTPLTSRFERLSDGENEESAVDPHIMSVQEIMHKYWRINMSVRLASLALQRWMSSITLMITAWSAIRMVYWLSHTPSLAGVFMFILPLLLLPLLASSYSEVNYEGGKILKSILPTQERIHMFQYLYGQPILMAVYGHAVTYGTIGTVAVGILVAFTSKIFLQEINTL